MPNMPDSDRGRRQDLGEQYERTNQRARVRMKKRRRDLALVGACLLAVILLVVCVVMIVKEITGGADDSSSISGDSLVDTATLPEGEGGEEIDSGGEAEPTAAPIPKAENPNVWYLRIVNASAPLDSSFTPGEGDGGELVTFTTGGHYIVSEIATQLKQMIADCNAVAGNELIVYSGYRSYDYQAKQYTNAYNANIATGMTAEQAVSETARLWDTAGTSEHQLGLAVDFLTGSYQHKGVDFDKTPEFAWLMENAANYGFILRYPEDKVQLTGTDYKPWHWRYVGTYDAYIIKEAGICLEEYVDFNPATLPATDSSQEQEVVVSAGNKGY